MSEIFIKTNISNTSCIEWDYLIPSLTLELTGSSTDPNSYLSCSFVWQRESASITANTTSVNQTSTLTFDNNITESAGRYWCIYSSASVGGTSSVATLSVVDLIKTQPIAATYTEWDNINISVITTGSSTPSFQWQKNNANITNATKSLLSAPIVVAAPNQYQCFISSGSLSKTSSLITISTINPLVKVNPVGSQILEGEPISFTATFSSSIPVSQTWYRNGSIIAGETAGTLNIPAGKWFQQLYGTYTSVGTTTSGSATSNGADANVIPGGAVISSPMTWDGTQYFQR
jgi:hypothetical protein